MISSIFSAKLSALQIDKIIQVANDLNIQPNWLAAVMYFETAKTLSPSKSNGIGSVGLIQFTRDKAGVNYKTINRKRYLLADLKKMSFIDQMDVVKEYYIEAIRITKKVPSSFVDTYLITFFPLAVGKNDNFIFKTRFLSSELIARQNPIFAIDGVVKKINVENMFKKWYGSIFSEINIKKKTLV